MDLLGSSTGLKYRGNAATHTSPPSLIKKKKFNDKDTVSVPCCTLLLFFPTTSSGPWEGTPLKFSLYCRHPSSLSHPIIPSRHIPPPLPPASARSLFLTSLSVRTPSLSFFLLLLFRKKKRLQISFFFTFCMSSCHTYSSFCTCLLLKKKQTFFLKQSNFKTLPFPHPPLLNSGVIGITELNRSILEAKEQNPLKWTVWRVDNDLLEHPEGSLCYYATLLRTIKRGI